MEQELIKFLKKHRVYKEFTKNAKVCDEDSLSAFCKRTNPINYIASGLVWGRSSKGFSFWMDLDNKWAKPLINKLP